MDLDKLLIIIAIIGPLVTAIGTAIASRNQLKETDVKVEKITPIDIAEKLNTISLALTETIQKELNDCYTEKDEIEKALKECLSKENISRIKTRKLLSRLRTIREKHDKLFLEYGGNCKGYDILNSLLDALIEEIDNDLREQGE